MLYRRRIKSLIAEENVGKEQVDVTLIFATARHLPWLSKILKTGFSHIRICVHKKGHTILIDPRLAYNDAECYEGVIKIIPAEGETVVRVRRMVDIYKVRRLAGPLNCVETAKAFIGDKSFWCFTPYQLYKRVKGYGTAKKKK